MESLTEEPVSKRAKKDDDALFNDEINTQIMEENTWVKVGEEGYDDDDDDDGKFIKIYKGIITKVHERIKPIFKEHELEISCQKGNTIDSDDDDTKIL